MATYLPGASACQLFFCAALTAPAWGTAGAPGLPADIIVHSRWFCLLCPRASAVRRPRLTLPRRAGDQFDEPFAPRHLNNWEVPALKARLPDPSGAPKSFLLSITMLCRPRGRTPRFLPAPSPPSLSWMSAAISFLVRHRMRHYSRLPALPADYRTAKSAAHPGILCIYPLLFC